MGLDVIKVPGGTGYIDTNYEGKADAALKALADGYDFVYVHIESTDEVSHAQDLKLKLQAIEDFDRRIIKRVMDNAPQGTAFAVLPDHPVPLAIGRHTRTRLGDLLNHQRLVAIIDKAELLDQIAATGDRPLSRDREMLQARYRERYPKYCACADIVLPIGSDVTENTNRIIEALKSTQAERQTI